MTSMKSSPVIFRADANSEIGLGHLKRCVALALALNKQGGTAVFVCADDPSARAILKPPDFIVDWLKTPVNKGNEIETTLTAVKAHQAYAIVIDSYSVDDAYFERLRQSGLHVVYFEDYQKTDWHVDTVINGVVGAEDLPYTAPQALLGTQFLVLGPDYWNGPMPMSASNDTLEIAITMGGIDHYDLTSRAIALLDRVTRPLRIHVVIGPYYENAGNISAQAEKCRHETMMHEQPPSIADVIGRCHVGISAGGITLYEFATLGVPAVGIWLWENQRQNAERLGRAGAIVSLGYEDSPGFDEKLVAAIDGLISDPAKRDSMRRAGMATVDGRGAHRVARMLV